ncbi:MAG: HAMP domain-containing sensor histidine kinase, partial [Polyangiaceae bacterium]
DPETERLIERVRSSGLRMARMIDDLFDLSRARSGVGIPIERATVDALIIAQRAIAEQEQAAKDRSIVLTHAGSLEGNWDSDRIHQVLCNLLSNALRYGDPAAPITLTINGEPSQITLAVHNGGSIPVQVLPHIFDPFRQHAADKRTRTGLGLGLYIVDQILLAHGGKVAVASTPDEGTTFTVRLPRYDSPESRRPAG